MIAVVRTGTANLASVLAGFRRLGTEAVVTEDPDVVRRADRVVLPGVGTFGASLAALRAHGADAAIVERVAADRPTLCVCVGLQMLAEASEESPGAVGLGVVPGVVTRFVPHAQPLVRVPQLGWNLVEPEPGCTLPPGFVVFANSYKLDALPPGWTGALAHHGAPFVAAIQRGHVLACQFHPELSGRYGAALLERFVGVA